MTTLDYNVVMAVISIRFSDDRHHQRLKDAAAMAGTAVSPLAEQLIEEGLRMRDHPMIFFREEQGRRRARLHGGPEVIDVLGAIIGSEIPAAERKRHAADLMAIPEWLVDAAMAYYAEFTDEIDEELAARVRFADHMEARWRRAQELLGS